MSGAESAPAPLIERRILFIRGQKVLLDRDLARLYQIKPIALRQQVRRNPKRFPSDFLFELDEEEVEGLLSQNVIPSRRSLGGSRPLAFTEQGIAMLSSVLTSERAIEVNIAIMRTFVRLRHLVATHEELARRLEQLEWRQNEQGQQIEAVFETIQNLIQEPAEDGPQAFGSDFRLARPIAIRKWSAQKGRNDGNDIAA
ncbi:MAG: ORF6N domain-containing protein [Bryobacteraceae bacterium]